MKPIQILLVLLSAGIFSACTFNLGKKGNGHVVSEERQVSENFTEIKASGGLDIYLIQGNENKIEVEADENLLEQIQTYIKNGKLYITSKNIGKSSAKNVYVTFIELNNIQASSGVDIVGKSVLKSEELTLKTSSGAELKLEVLSREIKANSSSGAEMELSGKATSLYASASSGSELNAKNLLTINCTARASSGSEIKINVQEKLTAKASSGGSIDYYGNPLSVESNKSSSGSVKRK